MKTKLLLGAVVLGSLAMLSGITVWACGYGTNETPRDLGELITDFESRATAEESKATDQNLIEELRRHGIVAVNVLSEKFASQLTDPGSRFSSLFDRVAGQYDAKASGLFWHTDFADAAEESKRTGRPILSLRMLGRLDEEYSCANSRFFRRTLYPNTQIAKTLRERFILHWKPVCEVPVVTIDFGNGRKLKRPITGNSVHLIVDAKAQVVDALPGLVTPEEFTKWLGAVNDLWEDIQDTDPENRFTVIQAFHRHRVTQARKNSDLVIKLGQPVRDLNPMDPKWNNAPLISLPGELVSLETEGAAAALPIAPSKFAVEGPLLSTIQSLPADVGSDTAFNLLALQPKIDDWFANAPDQSGIGYDFLTEKIYRKVFLMPLDDPWLGLSPEDSFVALRNGGRIDPFRSQKPLSN